MRAGRDLAFQKSFRKNNAANVMLSGSDIFRARRMDQYSACAYFTEDSHRMPDVPMDQVNLSWNFGQMDMSHYTRTHMKEKGEGPQNAMQGNRLALRMAGMSIVATISPSPAQWIRKMDRFSKPGDILRTLPGSQASSRQYADVQYMDPHCG